MTSERGSAGYEVVVPGRLGPAYEAAVCGLGANRVAALSSVFFLRAPEGTGIPDIAAMLEARGLVILDIRQLSRH